MPLRAKGLVFEERAAPRAPHPNRADIAMFAGFVARGANPLPGPVVRWLDEQSWTRAPYRRADAASLLQVPVPVESFEDFLEIFDWDRRPVAAGSDERCVSTLGAAVRSFFAEGGRRCYVVRVGDPWPCLETAADHASERGARIAALLPGFPSNPPAASDRLSWNGAWHALGLPDAAFLSLPDLPEICGDPAAPLPPPPRVTPPFAAKFEECVPEPAEIAIPAVRRLLWPRCGADGLPLWAASLNYLVRFVSRYRRDLQVLAAVPLLDSGHVYRTLSGTDSDGPLAMAASDSATGISSAFLQLAYPWPRTAGSVNLPEGIESPEGVLAGLLARNALTRGTFASVVPVAPRELQGISPELDREQRLRLIPDEPARGAQFCLEDRVTVFHEEPRGFRLASDVTTSRAQAYRPASVNRLVSMLIRAARVTGADLVFESSGEALWRQARDLFNGLLEDLFQVGALAGEKPEEAFSVRCDRTTMTQDDLDNGRLVVVVEFQPSVPVGRITVSLALRDGGQVDLVSRERAA